MKKRVITGVIILILTALFVYLKTINALFFDAFILVISYGCLFETIRAYKVRNTKVYEIPLYFVPAILCAIFNLDCITNKWISIILMAILILCLFLTLDIIELAKLRKVENAESKTEKAENTINKDATLFDKTKNSMQILIYPTIVICMFFAFNHVHSKLSLMGIILSFAIAMMTDTFAQLLGMAFGKHKFVPEISPKKTTEGVIGGLFGGLIGGTVCFLIFYFVPYFELQSMFSLTRSIIVFTFVSLLGSYIDQLGDLIQSALKRRVGIKDMGTIFPGHGGFMDRVDGLMFVTTFVYVVFSLFLV